MVYIINAADDASLLPAAAEKHMREASRVFVQSERVGCRDYIEAVSKNVEYLDRFFEDSLNYEELKENISERIAEFSDSGVLFMCMGGTASNGIADAVIRKTGASVIPSPDLGDVCLAFAKEHFEFGAFLRVCASDIADVQLTGSEAVLVTNIYSPYQLSDVKLFLSALDDNMRACVVCGGEKRVCSVSEIDRIADIGTEACVFLPSVPYTDRQRSTFNDLVLIMERLRAKDGCPWDREQNHKTIAVNAIEEAYEVADAIDRDDTGALYDELGDLLLQVVFHAKIAKDRGEFDMSDVTTSICKKLIRRHPHIFGGVDADTADKVLKNWEQIKRGEKGMKNVAESLTDVPASMSALIRTQKIQKKAAQTGFDFDSAEAAAEKLSEEITEFFAAETDGDRLEEAGDMLFSVCNIIRKSGLSCETALMHANAKFIRRFEYMEKNAPRPFSEMSAAELDILWEEAKKY